MSKPTLTPPELRRRKADKEAEGHRLFDEWTKDGATLTDEQFKQLDDVADEVRRLDLQVQAAERWHAVDGELEDRDKGGSTGRVTDMPHTDDKNTKNGRHQYSLLKAIRARMEPTRYKFDGIEREVHDEMCSERISCGLKPAQGIMVPLDLPIDARASLRWAQRNGVGNRRLQDMIATRNLLAGMEEQRALDTTAGGGSIPTILDTTMIELLRPRLATYRLGARTMTDMQGLFAIPRQATAATFSMVTQGSAVTASNQTIDQVPFSPHTGGVQTQYTRQFLEQTNQDAEMFVREDHAAVVARGVETAALNGQGSGGYPLGILNNPQIDVLSIGTSGGAPTWTTVIAQTAAVAYFNADVGSLAFLTDALVRATLQTTLKISGSNFPIYLWNTEAPEAPVAGYPCGITNLLPQNLVKGSGTGLHALLYGNWEDLIYAFWSGMDMIVDPYTQAGQGAVIITTLQDFDVNVRHYQSFANCVDISITSGIQNPPTT